MNEKKKSKKRKLLIALIAIAAWAVFGLIIRLIFGPAEKEAFTVEIFAPSVQLGPLSVSVCTLWGFGVTAAVAVLAMLFRFICVPRFKQVPKGIQNVFELIIEKLDGYAVSQAGTNLGDNLSAYLMALGIYLVGCAALELFGVRSPSSDLLTTFALALVTFFLINYYGLARKGFKKRVKDFTHPSPVMAPIKVITDIATPVSMACRLFGNMLAGLIVMELLYYALGNFAAGPPAILGLYFNLFHPLIQAFIFITLSLSFIGEAAAAEE